MEVNVMFRFRAFQLAGGTQVYNYTTSLSNSFPSEEVFLSPDFLSHIGRNRQNSFQKDSSFGYFKNIFVNKTADDINEYDYDTTAFMANENINSFMFFLWFIKDCAAHLYETILHAPKADASFILSNHEIFTNTHGRQDIEIFTKDEVESASRLMNDYRKNIQKTGEIFSIEPGFTFTDVAKYRLNLSPYNNMHRIQRAMTFLNFARKQSFIPLKISMYVPIYECLFTDNEQEIRHKIGERCAYYLGGSKDEKIYNYNIIKEAYDIRSRILHGDKLSTKSKFGNTSTKDVQIEICKKLDNLTRIVLSKIIMHDYELFLPDKISNFYDSLIFN